MAKNDTDESVEAQLAAVDRTLILRYMGYINSGLHNVSLVVSILNDMECTKKDKILYTNNCLHCEIQKVLMKSTYALKDAKKEDFKEG